MISEFETLDNASESDLLGFLWDPDASPATPSQTLGIHPLQWLLYLHPEAVNPAVFIVEPFEPAEVGTYFGRVGCPGLVPPLKALADGKLTLELPRRPQVRTTRILHVDCGMTGAGRSHQRDANAGLVTTAENGLARGFTGKFVGSIKVVGNLLEGIGRWVEFRNVRTTR
jgi:hypothetical protein